MRKIKINIATFTYLTVTNLFRIIARLYLFKRLVCDKETRTSMRQKLALDMPDKNQRSLIWIHAASVGEAYSGLTVANTILKNFKNIEILITTSTITSSDIINNAKNINIIHQFLPLDIKVYVKKFLQYWNPKICIFMESEMWPNYFLEIESKQIPFYILNARFSAKSYKNWSKIKSFAKRMINIPNIISCQDIDTLQRFTMLEALNTILSQNIKYANPPLAIDQIEYKSLTESLNDKKFYIAASTHKGENKSIINIHSRLLKYFPNLVCIIAPRHLSDINEIIETLEKMNIKWSYLPSRKFDSKYQCYIINKIGILGTYFAISELAILGGSFQDHGGHNPIEALQHNCLVFHGKYTKNFKAIYQSLDDLNCSYEISDEERLFQKINYFFQNKEQINNSINNIDKVLNEKKDTVEEEIKSIIFKEIKENIG